MHSWDAHLSPCAVRWMRLGVQDPASLPCGLWGRSTVETSTVCFSHTLALPHRTHPSPGHQCSWDPDATGSVICCPKSQDFTTGKKQGSGYFWDSAKPPDEVVRLTWWKQRWQLTDGNRAVMSVCGCREEQHMICTKARTCPNPRFAVSDYGKG